MSVVSQSEFARRCGGISRQAVNKAIKAGRVVAGKDGIDLKHPTNVGYLAHALMDAAQKGKPDRARKPEKSPIAPVARATGKKAPEEKPEQKQGGKKPTAAQPESSPKDSQDSRIEAVRAMLDAAGLAEEGLSTNEVLMAIAQKGYWDTLKVKEDVLKRRLDRAREVGSVVDTRILESEVSAYHQGLVANFIDSPQRQAIQICQMLGAEGKEKQVMELLERDNEKRLAESDRVVKEMAKKLAARMRRKKAAA